jgi:hypothetical protein
MKIKLWFIFMAIALSGCHRLGPTRDVNPENKVNSPSSTEYKPPADENPIINPHTGQPRKMGESIQ